MKAFDRIREGLEQAIAHAAGEPAEAVIHRPHVPDVKGIRQKTGMTQEQPASRCHISVNTYVIGNEVTVSRTARLWRYCNWLTAILNS